MCVCVCVCVCVRVRACVRACVCVCVRERERERDRESTKKTMKRESGNESQVHDLSHVSHGTITNHLDDAGGRGDVVVEDAVERTIHTVVDKVHESGCGLSCHGNLSLADDVHGKSVCGTGKETACNKTRPSKF